MNSRYFKRFCASALAGVMALSMAPAALATYSMTVTGYYSPVEMAITVPEAAEAIINPYGLPYALDEEGTSVSGQQITSAAPLTIENRSVVPLSASVSITGKKTGGFAFNTTSTPIDPDSTTTKTADVFFEVFEADGIDEQALEEWTPVVQKFAALKSDDAAASVQVKGVTGTPDVERDVITLNQGTDEGALQDGGAAFVRLSGNLGKSAAWTEDDGFEVTVAFTFEPGEMVNSAGTLAGASGSTTIPTTTTGLKVTLSPTLPSGVTVSTWNWTATPGDNYTVTPSTTGGTVAATIKKNGTVTAGDRITLKVQGTGTDDKEYAASIVLTQG